MKALTDSEKEFIRNAAAYLEFPSFAARLAGMLGKPVERGIELLPAPVRGLVEVTSRQAIEGALGVALSTLKPEEPGASLSESMTSAKENGAWHTLGTGLTGAVGGFLGLPAIVVELPLTTTVMLRSIADTAARFGEDIDNRQTQLECLAVFSLGGRAPDDDAAESSYYAARIALAQLAETAAKYVAGKTAHEILKALKSKTAPPLVELVIRIASRYNVVVGQKALGQLVPVVGAAGGAILNIAFTEHFNEVARYHFGLRRLEREHGKETVQKLYDGALAERRGQSSSS